MKKSKDYTIQLLVLCFGLAALFNFPACYKDGKNKGENQDPAPVQTKRELIAQNTDERGLISVIFRDGKDTFALDYLTEREMDSVFNIQDVPYFNLGQVLLPDYVCPDTLIVTNAAKVNRAMAYYEQGILDGGDGLIDSLMHTGCKIKQPY